MFFSQHLDETPLQYLVDRYQTGEDKEELSKANRVMSEEEKKKMAEGAVVVVEGQKRTIDELVGRKKVRLSDRVSIS